MMTLWQLHYATTVNFSIVILELLNYLSCHEISYQNDYSSSNRVIKWMYIYTSFIIDILETRSLALNWREKKIKYDMTLHGQ